eukprot:sb/3463416/
MSPPHPVVGTPSGNNMQQLPNNSNNMQLPGGGGMLPNNNMTPSSGGGFPPTNNSQDHLNKSPLTPSVHSIDQGMKRRKQRKPKTTTTVSVTDRTGPVPVRSTGRNTSPLDLVQPALLVDQGVRGRHHTRCRLTGSYGRASLVNNTTGTTDSSSLYRDLRARLKRRTTTQHSEDSPPSPPSQHVTVLTPQQEKMLCLKFGVSPAEAQRMYIFQQHKHLRALNQIKGEGAVLNTTDSDKSRILEQIRLVQKDGRDGKVLPKSVKQDSDGKPPIKPMLQLTKPTPPSEIKEEPRPQLPFSVGGEGDEVPHKPSPPTDETSTRVINLRNAFQMLSDFLGMKLKKLNLASLNELRVQNIVPAAGPLGPQNLICYNCNISLHPNKLKTIAAGKPYYGIKDEHGGTFCCDSCLAHYYCKKFSSLRGEGEPMPTLSEPPPLQEHPAAPLTPSDRSPGKRRREGEGWRYWRAEDVKPLIAIDQHAENKRLLSLFAKWHDEWTMKVEVEDKRVCLLCGGIGDGLPNGTSRLLNYGCDKWVHLNCALWSNDVYETRDGSLANVTQICKRALDTFRWQYKSVPND